jgi:hypothetical protein
LFGLSHQANQHDAILDAGHEEEGKKLPTSNTKHRKFPYTGQIQNIENFSNTGQIQNIEKIFNTGRIQNVKKFSNSDRTQNIKKLSYTG